MLPSNHVTGCRCCDCEWVTKDDMLPDECPSCGGEDVMFAYSDDAEWDRADQANDEEKSDRYHNGPERKGES